MQAGKLRERITLEQKVSTRDDLQGEVRAWVPYGDVWASIDSITGREVHIAVQTQGVTTHRVVIRQPGPLPDSTWRAVWGSVVLSIDAVLPHPDRDRLTLLCSVGLNNG